MLGTTDADRRRVVEVCRARLSRLPVARHPALRFLPGLEGYKNYLFGARAGPSVNVDNLLHELAHAAQFGPLNFRTRCTESGFLFKMRLTTFQGHTYAEMQTTKAIDRELETFAFQLHFRHLVGYREDEQAYCRRAAAALVYMPDWLNVPGSCDEKRTAYCVKKIEDAYSRIDEKDAASALEGWLDATYRRWRRNKRKPQDFGGYAVIV